MMVKLIINMMLDKVTAIWMMVLALEEDTRN